jgi:flagellar biosynthesis/type III secretory pathway protein FliH
MLLNEWNIEDAKTVWQREAKEDGLKLGEERGINIGEERGLKIGEERGLKIGEERGLKIGEARGEEKSDIKWKSVIADKDSLIAELKAQLGQSN